MSYTFEQLQAMGATPNYGNQTPQTSQTPNQTPGRSYSLSELQQMGATPKYTSSTPDILPEQPQSIFKTIATSPLNPVRDIVSGTLGGLIRLSPSFRNAQQSYQQAQKIGTNDNLINPEDILQQGGVAPTAKQIAGSAISTGSLFLPGGPEINSIKGYLGKLGMDIVQGFGFGVGTAMQENKDTGEAIKQGLLTALFNHGISLGMKSITFLGKVLTTKLPERLFSSTFRETPESILSQAQRIAKGETGTKTQSLAQQALKAGVAPGGQNELVGTVKTMIDTEKQLKSTIGIGKIIDLGDTKPYINFLEQVKKSYSGSFQSGFSDKAQQYINTLKQSRFAGGKGNIPAETALELKRFMDGMRNSSAFRLDTNLAPKQEQFKAGADLLRKTLRKQIPGVSSLLDKEQQFIQFMDAIASENAKRGNSQMFNLFDAIVGGESLGAGIPFKGIGLDAVLRTLQQPTVMGKIGKGLYKTGQIAANVAERIPQGVTNIAKPVGRLFKTQVAGQMGDTGQ